MPPGTTAQMRIVQARSAQTPMGSRLSILPCPGNKGKSDAQEPHQALKTLAGAGAARTCIRRVLGPARALHAAVEVPAGLARTLPPRLFNDPHSPWRFLDSPAIVQVVHTIIGGPWKHDFTIAWEVSERWRWADTIDVCLSVGTFLWSRWRDDRGDRGLPVSASGAQPQSCQE